MSLRKKDNINISKNSLKKKNLLNFLNFKEVRWVTQVINLINFFTLKLKFLTQIHVRKKNSDSMYVFKKL